MSLFSFSSNTPVSFSLTLEISICSRGESEEDKEEKR